MTSEEDLLKRYREMEDDDVIGVIINQGDYTPEAVAAAEVVLSERDLNIPSVSIEDTKNRLKVEPYLPLTIVELVVLNLIFLFIPIAILVCLGFFKSPHVRRLAFYWFAGYVLFIVVAIIYALVTRQ